MRAHPGLVPDDAVVKSLRGLARREGVNSIYVSRMDNLTTRASAIVAAVLKQTLLPDLTLFGGRPASAVGGAAEQN